jgi:hypothetical protein
VSDESAKTVIIPAIPRQSGPHRAHDSAAARSSAFRVEPAARAASQTGSNPERRSSETLANANALRLGIAAQMLSSHEGLASSNVLPTHPSMRMAARYATTLEGAATLGSLGFERRI